MTLFSQRFILCCAITLGASSLVLGDVTLRPGDKLKETTKDFQKDIKKNGYPTPEPHGGTFNFIEGLSVDVELNVATSFLGSVKFTIRDAPQHGKLSEIRQHPSGESNRAIVTYTHTGTSDELVDRFTFQAKIADGITSAPGVISLIGKRSQPHIEVLVPPRFKRLQPGEQDAARVVITNTGTAPFSADLTWPAPFVGPPHLELAIQEKQTFMLMLKADQPGAYRVDKELQTGVGTSRVQAYVECVQPFVVTPSALTMPFDAKDGNRSATVKVFNGSEAPLHLKLEAPARLDMVKELTVDPKSDKQVLLTLDAKDVDLFHGELWVIQEPHREKVVIHAEPEPPQVHLVSPADGKIDFGKIEKGKKGEAVITVANEGGVPAILSILSLPAPFSLSGGDSPAVQPGKQTQLALTFNPEQTGDYKNALIIGGNGGKIEVSLIGTMFDPKRPTTAPTVGNPHNIERPSQMQNAAPQRESALRKANAAAAAPDAPSTLNVVPRTPEPAPEPAAPAPAPAAENTSNADAPAPDSIVSTLQKMSPAARDFQAGLMTWGIGAETLPSMKSAVLDRVPAIGLKDAGKDYVVVAWQAPKVEPKQYLLQTSAFQVNTKTGLPFKTWTTVTDWKPVTMPAGVSAARIEGLEPDRQYEYRVLGVDQQGKFSPASDLLQIVMPPVSHIPTWVWLLIIGTTIGAGVFVARRIREQRELAV